MNEPKLTKLWDQKLKGLVRCCIAEDLKNDGTPEIIAGDNDNLHIYNGKGKKLHKIRFKKGVDACFVADINNDGKNDLVVRGTNDILRAFNQKLLPLWQIQFEQLDPMVKREMIMAKISLPDPGGNCCFVTDITNDGEPEVLMDLGKDTIRLVDGQGLQFSFSIDLRADIGCIFGYDMTGDGMNELLVGAQNKLIIQKIIKKEIPEAGRKYLRESRHGAFMRAMTDLGVPRMKETDGTGALRFALTKEEIWRKELNADVKIICSHVGAVTNQTDSEIILGGAKGASEGFVSLLTLKGEEIWNKPFKSPVRNFSVGDVTFDGNQEIVFGTGSTLWALDRDGKELWSKNIAEDIQTCVVADINSDNRNELIIGAKRLTVMSIE